jgi:TPR repeat protein
MWRSFIGAFLALSLSSAANAQAPDPVQLGTAAYNSGNLAEALKNFRIAAAQGNAGAQHNLGVMYDKGEGVAQNFAEAVKWYRLAAAGGYTPAQYNLGNMYSNGAGVPQNYVKAAKWYSLAAAQGYLFAQHNLGNMYAKGQGVPKDYVQAYKWYSLAAAQGSASAKQGKDLIQPLMTPQQVAEGQRLSAEALR